MILGLEEAAQKLRDATAAYKKAQNAAEDCKIACRKADEANEAKRREMNQAQMELAEVANGKAQGLL